ncbi:hypothetical protein ACFWIB_17020 [Streptomyces sp. NPDC127051]|uniref:hypothetical protein n=1 Tax=Streptomyces sp. NPDC127051 TaxID=3347119 RepID=UPI0036660EFA
MTLVDVTRMWRELRQDDPRYSKKCAALLKAEREIRGEPEPDAVYLKLMEFGAPLAPILDEIRAKGLRLPEFRSYHRPTAA